MFELDILTIIPVVILLISTASVYIIMKRNFSKKIVGNDVNKKGEPLVAESGGIALIVPFWLTIIFAQTIFGSNWNLVLMGAAVTVFCIVGFFDDNKHKFLSKPLNWYQRAIPIALTAILTAAILFPPHDPTNLVQYLWVIILAAFFTALASFSNTFEGLNGWTVGTSFIITALLTLVSLNISQEISFLFMCLNATIFGLLIFNRFPAKVFPGDSGTLLIGASIAGITLYAQRPFFAMYVLLLFLPHMVDFFLLKMITNRDDATQRKFRPYKKLNDGRLTIPDYPDKRTRYDFAKLVMKIFGPLKEWQIVLIIWIIVIINAVVWTIILTDARWI